MLIICDFDGTITLRDVTNLLLDQFTGREWRNLLEPYRSGQLTHLEIMQQGYLHLKTPLETLLEYAREHVQLRANFAGLVEFCKARGWPLYVVSGGLDFYIKAFLPEEIPFYSYLSDFNEYWRVRLPETPILDMAAGHDFKVRVVEELQLEHPDQPIAFIGDGFNDWQAGSRADYLFTVAGSRLSLMSKAAGKPYTEFTDFAQIVTELANLRPPAPSLGRPEE